MIKMMKMNKIYLERKFIKDSFKELFEYEN